MMPATPNPLDWRERWDEPLEWPGAREENPDDALAAHRAFTPDLASAALVLIDIDKKSFDRQIAKVTTYDAAGGAALARRTYDVVLPNQIRLLEFFRARQRPVVFVQWGWHRFQYPPLERVAGEELVIKHTRGAFGGSALDAVLRRKDVKTVVCAGADTIMCVASTVRGAIDHNYRAVLVEDACLSVWPQLHDYTMATLGCHQAHIKTTDEIVALD